MAVGFRNDTDELSGYVTEDMYVYIYKYVFSLLFIFSGMCFTGAEGVNLCDVFFVVCWCSLCNCIVPLQPGGSPFAVDYIYIYIYIYIYNSLLITSLLTPQKTHGIFITKARPGNNI
jgi:hypothetical protein